MDYSSPFLAGSAPRRCPLSYQIFNLYSLHADIRASFLVKERTCHFYSIYLDCTEVLPLCIIQPTIVSYIEADLLSHPSCQKAHSLLLQVKLVTEEVNLLVNNPRL